MEREDIKVVHLGQAQLRFQAMMHGTVDAAMLMEPFIALAEKRGCHEIIEGFYVGSEMFAPTLERETAEALQRAITRAVHLINADTTKYLHHIIADVPPALGTADSRRFSPVALALCRTTALPGRRIRAYLQLDV